VNDPFVSGRLNLKVVVLGKLATGMGKQFFSGYTFGAFCVLLAILMIVTVTGQIVTDKDLHPRSQFQALLANTIVAGGLASILVEKLDVRLLDN